MALLLDRLGVSAIVTRLRSRLSGSWLTVLTYHRTGRGGVDPRFGDDAFDSTEEQFSDEMSYLREHFRFVDCDDVIDFLDGKPLPPNPVLVTFDDGYAECVTKTLPILKQHGARATFFIATDYVEQRKLFWWDRLRLMLAELQRPSISLSYPYPLEVEAGVAYKKLTRLIKAHRGLDLPRFMQHVAELCGATDLEAEERRLVESMIMTWDQVRELHAAGMDVQSHTCSHRVLHTLLDDELTHELVRSRAELEQRLDKSVRAIAYPVGHRIMDTPSIVRSLDEAGYLAGFTNATGPVMQWSKPHRFDIPRVAHAAHWTTPMFRTTMALPIISPVHKTRPPAPTNSA